MKRFIVDVYWDFARSYEVDADSKEDAEHKLRSEDVLVVLGLETT